MADILQNNPQDIIFKVHNRPYRLWGVSLGRRNLQAIDNIDSEYFGYLADLYYEQLKSEHKQKAALAIRTAYGHAVETLFSLICAALQAPQCFYAWMLKYQPGDVAKIIKEIDDNNFGLYLSHAYNIKISSWTDFAKAIHFVEYKKELETIAIEYGNFWQELSREFLGKTFRSEYNSIKHGFRAKSGGFTLKVGTETSPSKIFPEEKIKILGSSEFGNTFLLAEEIEGKEGFNFKTRWLSVNWDAENNVHALHLISWSIHNIKMFLKHSHIGSLEGANVKYPEDIDYFAKPWKNRVGVFSFNIDDDVDDTKIVNTTRKDIEAILRSIKDKKQQTEKP